MKALTIKQPWADLIISGAKDIENRTWRTNFRGRIYVHAAQKPIKDNIVQFLDDNMTLTTITDEQYISAIGPHLLSAVIGEVDIIDCVLNHPSVWAEQMKFNVCPDTGIKVLCSGQNYVWNWVLENPVKYDNPITGIKGKLSFWDASEVLKEARL